MKICVYAICKNEEKFVNRWVNSMKEADIILVGDTGSSDETVKKLKEKGVNVIDVKVKLWRFDEARNKVLEKINNDVDICVCTDLDEVFIDGWRGSLEKIRDKDITRIRYSYNWSSDENGKPATSFYIDKIHNKDYKWIQFMKY